MRIVSQEHRDALRLASLKHSFGNHPLEILLQMSADRRKERRTAEYKRNHGTYKRSKSDNTALLRHQALLAYSNGVIQCACCGELEYEFLTIDHIVPRKEHGHDQSFSGRKLYLWLKRNNYPAGFQVYCWNCNLGKHRCGECPHKLNKEPKIPFRDIKLCVGK